MRFQKRRGRPVNKIEKTDKGTKELQEKKKLNITTEPLDLCLKKDLINNDEHEAGIRLRWLYTLRFGSPDISAYSMEYAGASCFRDDDSQWINARYLEYTSTLTQLEKIKAKRIVMNVCIFNYRAPFLLPYKKMAPPYENKIFHLQFMTFKSGMKLLSEILGKRSQ